MTERIDDQDNFPETNLGVICPVHGQQGLQTKEYNSQMMDADNLWTCPMCGMISQWDDDRYEGYTR